MLSSFRDFESFLEMFSILGKNDIQLILKQYISKFVTYKVSPGAYTFKKLSEDISGGFNKEFELRKIRPNHKLDKHDSIPIENGNFTLITTLTLRPHVRVLWFDSKSFFNTLLGVSQYWDYENRIGHGDGYYSEKNRKLSIFDEIHLKCDYIDGSVLTGVRQPRIYSLILDKPPGYKVFSESETFHHKKIK